MTNPNTTTNAAPVEKRDGSASRWGFILACIGSAVAWEIYGVSRFWYKNMAA